MPTAAAPAPSDDALVEVGGAQTTKTRKALEYFSEPLRSA